MKDLSIVQEYLLCALNEKGKIPITSEKVHICILAGGIIELLQKQCIKFDGKNKLVLSSELPKELIHLKSLYESIKKREPASVKKIVSDYTMALTNDKLNTLISDLCDLPIQKNCVRKESGGMFGNKSLYIPNFNEVDKIVQKVRAELLEDYEVTDETVALVSLLDKSGMLKKYFSKHEAEQLRARLKEIKETSNNQLVKQMVSYVDNMNAVIAVFIAN